MSAVSVVIPCFNHGKYLQEAIDSVLAQTVPVKEVVVVDDGSSDPETLRELDRIRGEGKVVVLSQENAGPSAARNRGIEGTSGEYLVSLDADDRLRPGFVEQLLPLIEGDDAVGIAYGQAYSFGAQEGVATLPPYEFPQVLLDPCIYATALFRRADWEAVGGYREEMRCGWEDFEFWLSIIESGRTVAYLPEPVFDYRRHETSRDVDFSASRERVLDTFEKIFQLHRNLYSENIRLLFEAHWERLEWRRRFCEPLQPEIGFIKDGELERVRADELICSDSVVTTVYRLVERAGEFRFDPFHGPGEFSLLEIACEQEDGTWFNLAQEQVDLLDHSFGQSRVGEGVLGSTLFLAGWDAFLRLRLNPGREREGAGRVRLVYRVRRGAEIVPEFFQFLSESEARFNEQGERLRGAELELAHVKSELEKEMNLRRRAQANWGYRLTRPVSRWWEGRKGRS